MRFVCERYPELVVHDLGVVFRDGEAEVTDKDTIEALRTLSAEFGVRAVGGRPTKSSTSGQGGE